MTRRCGNCTLCCRLLPQAELSKPANCRCKHQRFTGCSIYEKRPFSCREWSCRWLLELPGTASLRRPDFAHYVIDLMPDFVTARQDATGESSQIPVLQVWVDPRHPDAHLDPELRAYIERRGEEDGMAALIRYGNDGGFVIFPPAITGGRGWVEHHDGIQGREHTAAERLAAMPDLIEAALHSISSVKEPRPP